jgi:hypothetical protein
MTVTLNLPSDVEQAYIALAQARGLPLAEVMREVLVAAQSAPSRSELSPEDWVREFRAWTRSHDADNLPLLSDEAISREAIYRERGL